MLCNSGFLLKVMTVLPTWLDHIEEFKTKKNQVQFKTFSPPVTFLLKNVSETPVHSSIPLISAGMIP